ncbi:DDT domain-containing protein DDR4-like [Silene latifolia]|uniref:DDT domain-containing protein DDR4-like n=1 Tax=Silene latifolia TaxID=37657 RepID=UPI003D76FDBC
MNDTVLDPIQGSSGGLDVNGDTNKPESENPGLVEEKLDGISSSNVVVSSKGVKNGRNSSENVVVRRERPTRACTTRPPKYVDPPVIERRPRVPKKEKVVAVVEEADVNVSEEENEGMGQCSKVVTSFVNSPTPEQMPRWRLRSMWELASILHFFNVFRPLLNITVEFSAEELESALLTPNGTLGDVHIPLLKSIPPVTRMACGRDTWVTVLCRKLRDWWHWVAEGELPIVSSQGAETETYKNLDPAVRVVILKALCDIRVEQDDIRSYIDNSVKQGVQLSAFRKARIGGDSHGISYWYEDDELIGHRLYRESRKVEKNIEVKKGKTKGSHVLPSTCYEWETVATNLDEFLDVSEKLFSSTNRTEVSLGKKLKNDMIPEIEKIQKKKEKWLKKQQRQALLLDNFVSMDGLGAGRSLRDRKPVTYTFDDFDRSINEAIKVTKRKQASPEPGVRRELTRSEPSTNGRCNGSSRSSMHVSFSALSPSDVDEMDEDHNSGPLDRSSRRRQKSQRYSEEEFVGALSDDEYVASDDDIVGEAVYYDDEEDLEDHKQKKKVTSSSEGEGEEEYDWSDENEEDELEEEDSMSVSEDSDQPRKSSKETQGRARRQTRLRSTDDMDPGLRRSKRSTRNQIDYQKYEFSESETDSIKQSKANPSDYSMGSQVSDDGGEEEDQERGFDQSIPLAVENDETQPSFKSESPSQDEIDKVGERRFLDLNELAPGSGFEDGPGALVKDDDGKDE